MKLGTLVHVMWVDSTTENKWTTIDGMVPGVDVCESVGWLVRDTRKFVTVAGSLSRMTSAYAGVMTIPRVAIKSLVVIHLAKHGK
jgi:hypothetical protein